MVIRHAAFYTDLSARATENSYGTDQIVWARQIKLERDNILTALANAVDSGNAKLAVQIVASHPLQYKAEGPTGEVLAMPASPVVGMPGAAQEPGYPLVLLVQAYNAQATGDWDAVAAYSKQALEAERSLGVSRHGHRIEMDTQWPAGSGSTRWWRLCRCSLGVHPGRRIRERRRIYRPGRHLHWLRSQLRAARGHRNRGSDREGRRSRRPGPTVRYARRDRADAQFAGTRARRPRPHPIESRSPGEHRTRQHAGRGNIVGCSHRQPRRRPASGLEPHPRTDCSDHAPMAMEQCPDAKRAVPRAVRTSVR